MPNIVGNGRNSGNDVVDITVSQIDEEIDLTYVISEFQEIPVEIENQEYKIIRINDEPNILNQGSPDIPSICRSIVISDTEQMKINIVSTSYEEYSNVLIAPSKGNLLRSVNPDEVPYEFGDVYTQNAWYPDEIVNLREPYILRDYRAQVVEIFPIQYNPVTKVMRFYTDISIEVKPDGADNINCIYREELPTKVDFDFKTIYNRHFINFGLSSRYDPVAEQGNLLIISYDDFIDEMQPFVDWKLMKGIPTEIVKVSEIGNANAIKTYIQNYYYDQGLTFVLLVGDAAQVPTLSAGGYGSDPSYTYVAGSDHYPDLFVGRFSAQNSNQVITQVERSVEYEKFPQTTADWYNKATGVASSQGAGIGDEGEADWEHMRNLRTLLMDYTYTEIDELYDGSQGGEDAPGNPTPTMVADACNDGRSFINYCGHGSPYSWGSSGFSTSDINSLVNDNMLPYVTCVACNNGQFDDYDECFCEAWLRATNNGEPTGGIASTGSTKGMSWAPPMDAQDEFTDLIVETYPDNIKHTIGGIHYNGVMHMNDDYGSSGIGETDTWHVFGDPSLWLRTDIPAEMTVYRDDEIEEEATSFEVTVSGVEGALCALSRNGELLGSEYTDGSGNALITLEEPVMGEDPLDLVITAYNKMPYIIELPVNTNDPPNIPDVPNGPDSGQVNIEYTFTASTTDPDGDQIYYQFKWGDGSSSEWVGPFSSGQTGSASHRWSDKASYGICVKAKDTEGGETDWSEKTYITITKARSSQNTLFIKFIQGLIHRFPILEKLLQFMPIFNNLINI